MNKKFALFVLLMNFGFIANAQPDTTEVVPTNSILRVLMVLEDTTAYPCPCMYKQEYKLYKFKIAKTFSGEPERNLIAVCAAEKDILQFNPLKEKGKEYWWMVCQECIISGLPVYRLCGKF